MVGKGLTTLLLAAAALGTTPMQTARAQQESGPPAQYHVRHPGTVLVDRDARLAELTQLGPMTSQLCHVTSPDPDPDTAPILTLEGRVGYGGNDKRVTPFDWDVIAYGADAFGTGSSTALDHFMSVVTRWARAGAMTRLEDDVAGSNTSVTFGLERTLAALIPNWALVRADKRVKPDDRKLVDAWIGRMVDQTDTNTGGRGRATRVLDCPANQETNNCNNHRYLRDEINIMWGALAGGDVRFRKGIERFRVALRQMRRDGSLPLETARGSRALWYQNYAIGMLVTTAEVAARQGYDLYGMTIDGKSIHLAISFLLNGLKRPAIVFPYAKANRSPGPGLDWREQDLRFMDKRGRWHHMAWLETYMHRFPNHPNTRRIKKEYASIFQDRPLATRTQGGMTSCFFALPPAQ